MASRQDLFCPDGLEADTGLPAVSSRPLEPGDRRAVLHEHQPIPDHRAADGAHRRGEAGSWIIDDQPLDEGDGWQDWPAHHRVTREEHARIQVPGEPARHLAR